MPKRRPETSLRFTEQVFGMLAKQASTSAGKLCATTGEASIDCMLAAKDMESFDACTRTASIDLKVGEAPAAKNPRCDQVEERATELARAGLEPQRGLTFEACKKGGEPVAECLKHAPSLESLQTCLASAGAK